MMIGRGCHDAHGDGEVDVQDMLLLIAA